MNTHLAILEGLLELLTPKFPNYNIHVWPYVDDILGLDITTPPTQEYRRICMIIATEKGIIVTNNNLSAAHRHEAHIEYADPQLIETIIDKTHYYIRYNQLLQMNLHQIIEAGS